MSSLLARLVSRTSIARRTGAQIEAHSLAWARRNNEVPVGPHQLWVVLGDSAAQGVGAAAHDGGYVGQLLPLLRGGPWRVINLSRSGARTRDVVTQAQQARSQGLLEQADLVTALVGGNDLTHTPSQEWARDVRALFAVLVPGAVVGTPPRGWREKRARPIVELVRMEAPRHGLRVADLWLTTGPPYRGKYADGFHPNELGYQSWVRALAKALDLG